MPTLTVHTPVLHPFATRWRGHVSSRRSAREVAETEFAPACLGNLKLDAAQPVVLDVTSRYPPDESSCGRASSGSAGVSGSTMRWEGLNDASLDRRLNAAFFVFGLIKRVARWARSHG